MHFNDDVRRGLALANNSNIINDQTYPKLLQICFNELLDKQDTNICSLSNSKPDVLKEIHATYLIAILECARNNVTADTLGQLLQKDFKYSTSRAKTFQEFYEKNKLRLQIKIGNIGTHLPHIVDLEWKIDYILKTSSLDEPEGPIFRVTLYTEQYDSKLNGKKMDTVKFSCNTQELQDLIYKLKDAVRHCNKIGSEH